jgi:hypothetical protein
MAANARVAPGVHANNPILNPGQPLSGAALYHAAQALANAQVNPEIQAIQQQQAQNNQQNTGALNLTGGYFNQLMGQAQTAAGNVQQQGSALNDQLRQIAADENTQLQGLGQNATDMVNRYTPGGVGQAGIQGLASEIARQQGLAAQQEGAQRAFGATQGANYTGFANSQVGTGALKGQEDLNQIAQAGQLKNAPLADKIAQLQASKGALVASNLGKLRQQEITNAITEKGLGIKQQSANTAANTAAFNQNPNAAGSPAYGRVQGAQTAAKNATTAAGKAQTAAQQQAFNQNPNAVGSPAWQRVQSSQGTQWSSNPNAVGSPAWARVQTANARGSSSGARALSTQANNTYWGKVGTVEQLIRDGQAHGQTEQQIRGFLSNGQNPRKTPFDQTMIQVAYELLGYGSINQTTAAILHNQYGVRGGTYKGQPIKVTPDFGHAPVTSGFGAPSQAASGVLSTAGF